MGLLGWVQVLFYRFTFGSMKFGVKSGEVQCSLVKFVGEGEGPVQFIVRA